MRDDDLPPAADVSATHAAPRPDAMPATLPLVHCALPTRHGVFELHAATDPQTGREHAALVRGRVDDGEPVRVRVHSECLTGDALSSLRCDCGPQLAAAMADIARAGCGVLVYLRQEGRGIGLVNKIRAYALQQAGADTVDANRLLGLPDDARDYAMAAAMLRSLGVQRVRLLTNNPAKVDALRRLGIDVVERLPLHVAPNAYNEGYLETKSRRMGHWPAASGMSPAPADGERPADSQDQRTSRPA